MDHRKLRIGKRSELLFLALMQSDEVWEKGDRRGWQVHYVMSEVFGLRYHYWLWRSSRRSISRDFAADDGTVISLSKLTGGGAYKGVSVLTERADEL